jgi:uncharacterized membrane protein YeiH
MRRILTATAWVRYYSSVLYALELIGISVFAVSGALAAGRRHLDLIGVVVIALATAMGGGTVRDLLLDRHPVVWLASPIYLGVIVASAFLTMAWVRWRPPPEKTLLVVDALGLALFSVTGAEIAQREGLPAVSCVVLGTITGSMGGVLRDVFLNEVPQLFRPGALYATAALAGTSAYFILQALGVPAATASMAGIAVVALSRLAAIWWSVSLPAFKLGDDTGHQG